MIQWSKFQIFLKYTEQKKKRNNRPPKIFEFNGKTLIILGLLLYDSHSWDIRVYHAKKLIFISIKMNENFFSS